MVVAQVGDTRRDIVYSGDVVNTGARLLQACKGEGVDGLASRAAVERFGGSTLERRGRNMHGLTAVSLSLKPKGHILLRGRAAELDVVGWNWPLISDDAKRSEIALRLNQTVEASPQGR